MDVVGSACSALGLPHLAGSGDGGFIKVKAGKNDDPKHFLGVCRDQVGRIRRLPAPHRSPSLRSSLLSHYLLTHCLLSHYLLAHCLLSHYLLTHCLLSHHLLTHCLPSHYLLTHCLLSHYLLTHCLPSHSLLTHCLISHYLLTHCLPSYSLLTHCLISHYLLTHCLLSRCLPIHCLLAAHAQEASPSNPKTSCGFSAGTPGKINGKAPFILALVRKFTSGEVADVAAMSDREAARLLQSMPGVGDWVAGRVLMDFLQRADIMLYGDLTIRNYLNELYDIDHVRQSETQIESAADFPDAPHTRNLIDDVAERHGWAPYRSIVCYLMYFLQEDNLVLL